MGRVLAGLALGLGFGLQVHAAAPGPRVAASPAQDGLKAGRVAGMELPAEPRPPFPDGRFQLERDDVVVWIGAGNLEASQKQGFLEALLTATHADHRLRFRNLAWEGDTVYEQWRDVNFGDWAQQLAWLDAGVLFVQFGQMEALDGREGIGEFVKAYEELLDRFARVTRRIVLVSPMPFETPPASHAPDLSQRNDDVAAYTEAVRQLAKRRGFLFVDLFSELRKSGGKGLTRDGIHLLPEAFKPVAEAVAGQLGLVSDFDSVAPAKLHEAIREKNRLWFNYWRPMNYAFAFGDRTHVAFGKGDPSLREELEQLRPLLESAEQQIDLLANGLGSVPEIDAPKRPHSAVARLTPGEELASFKLREDLRANLFASEEDGIVNPVQMRWDERGRLWVLCLPTYPHLEPGARPSDYVIVCEDTDGDGRADRFHRFVEGLHLPMGLELGDGGLYVGHGTELIHLKDTDGDGRADQRRVVLSGFGTGDSHQLINSLTWGPNGRLWFTQGHHVYSRVETPYGIEKHLKAGVWRFHPHRLRLDSFFEASTAGANCWGVAFDDWGQVFHNTGDQFAGYYTVPGMIRTDHPRRHIQLFTGSKNTCIEIIGTQHLPDDLQGAVAFAGFYNNSVPLYRVEEDGSGYRTERLPDLLTSTRREFRPVDIRVGPDGGLYLCDWYNEIVGHYQASYRDPRRDRKHGRIWRITARDRALVRPPDLAGMNAAQWVGQLRSPERWIRYQARRLLFQGERGEVVAACDDALSRLDDSKTGDRLMLLRLTGIYEAHEIFRPELMERLLKSDDERARCYGVRMIGNWAHEIVEPLKLLEPTLGDPHPRVRLEAVVAATYVDSPHAIEVATRVMDLPMDPFLDYALRQAVHGLADRWKPAFNQGRLAFDGRVSRLAFVLQEDGSKDVARHVRSLAASPELDAAARVNLLKLLANVGKAADLRFILEQGAEFPVLLEELAVVAKLRGVKADGNREATLKLLLDHRSDAVRAGAARLAGAWNVAPLVPDIRRLALTDRTTDEVRAAAMESMGLLQGRRALEELRNLAREAGSPSLRTALVRALSRIDTGEAARTVAGYAKTVTDQAAMAELLEPLMNRRDGASALAAGLKQSPPSLDVAKLMLRVLSAAGRNAPELQQVLHEVIGRQSVVPEFSEAFVARIAEEAKSQGDPERGRSVFESPLANCQACHRMGDQGGVQGPDLSSVGTGMTPERIVEAVLWPGRQVKEGYLATTVITRDEQFIQGYKVRENKEELTLRDAASGREIRIAKSDIEEKQEAGTLMPDGLTAGITHRELLDLIAYLTAAGVR